jgi:hypothetical protein
MNHLPFVDHDRFIDRSKPACYCCYPYISFHLDNVTNRSNAVWNNKFSNGRVKQQCKDTAMEFKGLRQVETVIIAGEYLFEL